MGEQIDLFAGDEQRRASEAIEREIAKIREYDAQKQIITDFWVVLRNPRPISINKAYSGLRRFLTKDGKHFEDSLKGATARALAVHPLSWNAVVGAVYKQGGSIDLSIWLYLDDLRNESWKVGGGMTKPKKGSKAKPQPQSPYKKKDGSNYIKLIEDAVVKGSGIDDSCHLNVDIHKREDRLDPRVVLHYQVFE